MCRAVDFGKGEWLMNPLGNMTNLYYNPVNPVPLQFQHRDYKRQDEMEPTEVFEKLLYKECEKNSRIIGTPSKPVQGNFNQFAFQRAGRTLAFVNQGNRQSFSFSDSEAAIAPSIEETTGERKVSLNDNDLGSSAGVEQGPQGQTHQIDKQSAGRI